MIMRKMVSAFLTAALAISLAVPVSATQKPKNDLVIVDNESVRIAESVEGNYRYVAIYDKAVGTVEMQKILVETGEHEISVVSDPNVASIVEYTYYEGDTAVTLSQSQIVEADCGYYYVYTPGNPNEWKLARPAFAGESHPSGYYFITKQTTVNKNDIYAFKDDVLEMRTTEQDIKTLTGTQYFITGLATGFLVGTSGAGVAASLAAYLAALNFGSQAQLKANKLGQLMDSAYIEYYDVFNNSSVYYD